MKRVLKGEENIVSSAMDVFYENSYDKVSIAKICKNAGVSNALFYKYFKNKDEIYKSIMDKAIGRVDSLTKNITGCTIEDRLTLFIKLNYISSKEKYRLLKIYREGQYRFIKYEQLLRKSYMKAFENIFDRKITNTEYIFIESGMRYININYKLKDLDKDAEFLAKLILNGIFDYKDFDVKKFDEKEIYMRYVFHNGDLKHQLLSEGEKLFGSNGVYETKISDLAKKVGGGIGGFYYYFKTKDDFFKEIVVNTQKILYFFLKDNNSNTKSPLGINVFYIYLFLEYYKDNIYKCQIMREVEFIEPSLFEDFKGKLNKLYLNSIKNIDYNEYEKEIICNFLLGISHYSTIEIFFTKSIKNKYVFLDEIKNMLSKGIGC
jgi:AcrR family transcriptional regulator